MDDRDIYIRREVLNDRLPEEFMLLAAAYLESAEKLNSLMAEKQWEGGFHRGRAVVHLANHAVELFLKGCILKVAPLAKTGGHSQIQLTKTLKANAPDIEFVSPFIEQVLPPYPELVEEARKRDNRNHERLRYPSDLNGNAWPGVHGFSPQTFVQTLATLRENMERVHTQLFTQAGPDN